MRGQITEDLSVLSLTPDSTDYISSNYLVAEALNYLSAASERAEQYPHFSDDDIAGAIQFILRIMDAPISLNGILPMHSNVHFLTKYFCNLAKISPHLESQLLMLNSRFFYFLHEASESGIRTLQDNPVIKDSPIAFFHHSALSASRFSRHLFPLYKAYAGQLHLDIRVNENQHPARNTFESSLRSARYFFAYMSPNLRFLSTHPIRIQNSYITASKNFFIQNHKNSEDVTILADYYYEQLFRGLISQRPIRHRMPLIKITDNQKSAQTHKEESVFTSAPPTAISPIQIPVNTGEEDFVNLLLVHPTEKSVKQKPYLSRSFKDQVNARNHSYWWEISCLKLFDLRKLYMTFDSLWGSSDLTDYITIYLMLLVHTGVPREKLIDLWSSSDDNPTKVPALCFLDNRYCLVVNTPIERKEPAAHPLCQQVQDRVVIPLPDKLSDLMMLKEFLPNTFYFSYHCSKYQKVRLHISQAASFLKHYINDFGRNITLPRMESSFHTMYCNRYGLSRLYSPYISGADPDMMNRSPLYYTRLLQQQLVSDYHTSFQRLDVDINTGFSQTSHRASDIASEPKSLFSSLDSTPVIQLHSEIGYGSPKVPIEDIIRESVLCLKTSIQQQTRIIDRHNMYTCYTYWCLQFATGLRPRINPDILHDDFLADYNLLVINDKMGPFFNEERLAYLPDTSSKLLRKLQFQFIDLKKAVAISENPSFSTVNTDRYFFLLDKNGNLKEFTLDDFRQQSEAAGIKFDFPNNMPRHYLRTHLHNRGIDDDTAATWLGHSHSGREALNVASSLFLSHALRKCQSVVELMLQDIGFEDIPYII